ncbi:MAG: LLM class F420-dependent oxidoreductase [Pseudomonadota bacterium]
MKIGIFGNFVTPNGTGELLADFAVRAEAIGVDSLWAGEHVVLFDEMEFGYPGSRDGRIPMPPGGGMLDTVASIGYLSAVTSTLRFGTGITLVPQRNPVYTAKEFASLDWLSGGRIDFGIGVGWCKEEVLACGYGWHDRGRRCDEFLDLIHQLWRDDVVHFDGEFIDVQGARLTPKPVQAPLPTLVGGHSPAAFKRTARFGQGWYGFAITPEMTRGLLDQLDAALDAEGRSRDDCEVLVTPPFRCDEAMAAEFAALGVDRLIVQLGSNKPENLEKKLVEFDALVQAFA